MTAPDPVLQPRLLAHFEMRRLSFHLHVDLEVGNEIVVLFGSSGSGKTSTLNAIAGLSTPDRGQIIFDGQTLFSRRDAGPTVNVPARLRQIGYVFQSYALFPHLTAWQNVAYSLRRQPDAQTRTEALLERMGLERMADRYPHELSGGQQQRVAIARALAAQPRVLLLDEPFSALDSGVRQRLQSELVALQQEMQLVVIYVTHRLEDAFALGHRLAVLQDGRLEQIGPIEEVFRYPANRQVAEVMGIRNLFRAQVRDAGLEGLVLDWDGLLLDAMPHPAEIGATVTAYIRPEDVKILYPDRPLMATVRQNHVTGLIQEIYPGPGTRVLKVLLPNGHVIEVRHASYMYASLGLQVGRPLQLSLRREALSLIG